MYLSDTFFFEVWNFTLFGAFCESPDSPQKQKKDQMEDFKEDIRNAVNTMRKGGIILYPTDTIWGLGCDATMEEAVQRVFQIKKREESKSMLCLVDAPGRLGNYVDIPDMTWNLLDAASRPMTIIYPNARNIAPSLIAEDGSAGFRLCNDPFCVRLCQTLRHPIVSTSANISGQEAARFFAEIDEEIKNSVDYIVRYRQKDRTPAKASSIIKLGINNEIQIIRK